MSKNAVKNLKVSQTDELFEKIRAERVAKIRGKVLTAKVKAKQLARITKLNYYEVEDKVKSLIEKKIK